MTGSAIRWLGVSTARAAWLRLAAVVCLGAVAAGAGPSPQAVTTPRAALAPILAAAASYVDALGPRLDGVVYDEDYVQQAQGMAIRSRRMKSEMAVLSDQAVGWYEFRDTTSVDGKPVGDRERRLLDIFTHPRADALAQARRIVGEGARFNISMMGLRIDRTVNVPMAALYFLQAANQRRSTFVDGGVEDVDGGRVVTISFAESAVPRLIGTADGVPATGRFWIDRETGGIRRSELQLKSARERMTVDAVIRVDYGAVAPLGLWLPKTMTERYEATELGTVVGVLDGHASYSNFRRFNVSVDERPAMETR